MHSIGLTDTRSDKEGPYRTGSDTEYWIDSSLLETCNIICCSSTLDNLSVGHQCCSKGGEDSRCQDHLHRAHSCGGGCVLAPST